MNPANDLRALRFGASIPTLLCLSLFLASATGAATAVEEPRSVAPTSESHAVDPSSATADAAESQGLDTVFDELLVSASAVRVVGPTRELGRDEITEIPYGDAAEVLRSVAGLAIGRMGGHGLEPRLRGMAGTNINILLDGAYVHNACPNRMDPPTSFGAVESFDRVVVLKGVQTLRYGAGGSAGTILYERETARFERDERWRLSLGTAYSSHSEAPDLTLDAAAGTPEFYLRAIGERRETGNYEDGAGREVLTAFDKTDASLALGWTPDTETTLELSYEANRTDDALFPGSGMDAPYDENNLYRLQIRRLRPSHRLSAVQSELYWGEIDHLMDNYSLRPLTAPMAAKAETASDTFGGRLSVDSRTGDRLRFSLGADFQRNSRQAVRSVGSSPETVIREQSILWPDVEVTNAGLYLEGVYDLTDRRRLLFGSRLDSFEAEAGQVDRQPFGPNLSPQALYETYYGAAAAVWRHDDVSGLLRLEQELADGPTLFVGLSRSVRAADATERYLASNNSNPNGRWVGNPGLDPARHLQLDLGASSIRSHRQLTGVLFFDRVDDFILRDRARGQSGVLQSDGASIYRNVSAELVGFEVDAWQRLTDRFALLGNAGWVRADNTTDGRVIAQIPPLQGRVRLDYDHHPWSASAIMRYALSQNRVDDDPSVGSGLDVGQSASYAVLDLLASHAFDSGVELQLGVENVLDRLYADHLNLANPFDPTQIRVNEPGRTVWLRLRLRPTFG